MITFFNYLLSCLSENIFISLVTAGESSLRGKFKLALKWGLGRRPGVMGFGGGLNVCTLILASYIWGMKTGMAFVKRSYSGTWI